MGDRIWHPHLLPASSSSGSLPVPCPALPSPCLGMPLNLLPLPTPAANLLVPAEPSGPAAVRTVPLAICENSLSVGGSSPAFCAAIKYLALPDRALALPAGKTDPSLNHQEGNSLESSVCPTLEPPCSASELYGWSIILFQYCKGGVKQDNGLHKALGGYMTQVRLELPILVPTYITLLLYYLPDKIRIQTEKKCNKSGCLSIVDCGREHFILQFSC